MIRKATVGQWTPARETVEAIGMELCSHWVATHAVPASPFWPRPVSWLLNNASRTHHFTSGGRLIR